MFSKYKKFWKGFLWTWLLGIIMIFAIDKNWYPRATMEANATTSKGFLIFAITCIALFIGYFNQQMKK
ncbi:MAG: hypothetical protein ORN85_06170 [Sediminibacterium sp.]|nr:hypothetical protein [Sediminibacterium sp.]